MTTRVARRAIGDAAIAVLCEFFGEVAPPPYFVGWGDLGLLDDIASRAGWSALHHAHPLNRHKAVLDALGRDSRFRQHQDRRGGRNGRNVARVFEWLPE